jgi:uncharacterized paraquat-inducible protein A
MRADDVYFLSLLYTDASLLLRCSFLFPSTCILLPLISPSVNQTLVLQLRVISRLGSKILSWSLTDIPIRGSDISILDERKIYISKHAFKLSDVLV